MLGADSGELRSGGGDRRLSGQLSPEGHAKATAYTQGGHWLLLWGCAGRLVVSFIILRTGVLHRIRKSIDGDAAAALAGRAAVALAFIGMSWVLGLPWSAYADWWREKSYGLTSRAFAGWLGENADGRR